MSFLQDILQVIIAPHKAFKQIITNPKYLGALIVLILFIGLSVGYEYSQFSKTYTEQTTPRIDQLSTFTNATLEGSDNNTAWRSSSNVALTNNFDDFYNYSIYIASLGLPPTEPNAFYSLFGNSSLQMQANNTNSLTAALDIEAALRSLNDTIVAKKLTPLSDLTVDCSPNAFQNISMTVKQVQPQAVPQTATLTLYSLSDTDFYQYNLTPQLSNISIIGQWNNLTLTLGSNADGWKSSGNPTWSNITALKLDFTYPSNSNITIQIGALFFHGQYLSPLQNNSTGVLMQFLQLFSLQFVFAWFILTVLIYLFCRYLLKSSVFWKPLFAAIGLAMVVMVIRALVSLAAAATLPATYYPFDISLGVRFDLFATLYFPPEAVDSLSATSQNAFPIIDAATSTFRGIVTVMAFISYIWIGALAVYVIGALKPEFSLNKRIALAVVGIGIMIFAVLLLVGVV